MGDEPKKGRAEAPIGFRHGYPAFHLFTGNLPVVSKQFHHPVEGLGVGLTAFDYYSGNLPVISSEFHANRDTMLDPLWVELLDPIERRPFFWHRRYRTRRDERPAPGDDGRTTAGEGDPDGAVTIKWIELFDFDTRHLFYVNMRDGHTQWARPDDMDRSGDPYYPFWEERTEGGKKVYVNLDTNESFPDKPDDFDGDIDPSKPIPSSACPPPPPEIMADLRDMFISQRRYKRRAGWLRKAGGGRSFFGGRGWRRRWVVFTGGQLSYYDSPEAAKKREAKKDVYIDVDNYEIEPVSGDAKAFNLNPILERTSRVYAADPKTSPEPTRSYEFEAESPEDRAAWLDSLGFRAP